MARSKQKKRGKQRRQAFYEAMPLAMPPQTTLPELRNHLEDSASVVSATFKRTQENLQQSRSWHYLSENTAKLQAAITTHTPARLKQLAAWRPSPTQRQAIAQRGQAIVRTAKALYHGATVHALWASQSVRTTAQQLSRLSAYATQQGSRTIVDFTPSVVADLGAVARRSGQAAASKKARAAYLVIIIAGSLAVAVIGLSVAATTLASYANDISSPAALLAKKRIGTTILDRNGKVLYEGYGAQDPKITALEDIPKSLKDATLAAEDPGFYDHAGFSWRGTTRAVWVDLTHGDKMEGGSTLTQQLVKNALLTSNKSFERKYQELLLSIELERRYSKNQILEMYLNETYYGQGASGVANASQNYFHKPVSQLTVGESALIAGLALGPGRFDPNYDLQAAADRRNFVLDRMASLGKITKAQAGAAKNQPLQLAAAGAPQTAAAGTDPLIVYAKTIKIQAPHFVFYVLDQLRAEYGDEVVEQGGITVQTSLDLDKQHLGEQAVANRISQLGEHHVTNGGLISLEPTTGDILAMVGSVDYDAPGFGNVNVTLSELQPGSSFKPIAYATAFKKGWNGATHVDDTPMVLPNGDGTDYIPQNYDLKFRGSVSLRQALSNSLNIPAIKVLQFTGIPDTLQTAHDLGITGLNDPSRYGLSLVLGGGEVRPIDMATVYATFANGGVKTEPRAILKVTDRHGKDITKNTQPKPQNVLDPRVAYMITSILSDNTARTPEFGANSPLKLSRPAAAKTGTTNDFRDNWTVGYTPQIATAVWVGNNDHSAMENVDGITGAAPIWHDYMEGALADLPVANFTAPAGVTTAKICANDGNLANPWDSGYDEVFMTGSAPTKYCNSFSFKLHDDKKTDPQDPTNPTPSPTPEATDNQPIRVPRLPIVNPFN